MTLILAHSTCFPLSCSWGSRRPPRSSPAGSTPSPPQRRPRGPQRPQRNAGLPPLRGGRRPAPCPPPPLPEGRALPPPLSPAGAAPPPGPALPEHAPRRRFAARGVAAAAGLGAEQRHRQPSARPPFPQPLEPGTPFVTPPWSLGPAAAVTPGMGLAGGRAAGSPPGSGAAPEALGTLRPGSEKGAAVAGTPVPVPAGAEGLVAGGCGARWGLRAARFPGQQSPRSGARKSSLVPA